jgi:hypothetical protein
MRVIEWLNRLGVTILDTGTNLFACIPFAVHIIGKYYGCLILFVVLLLMFAYCSAFFEMKGLRG